MWSLLLLLLLPPRVVLANPEALRPRAEGATEKEAAADRETRSANNRIIVVLDIAG